MSRTHYLKVVIGLKNPAYGFKMNTDGKIVKTKMSRAEAQALINKASRASVALFSSIVQLIARHGHIALGFSKPQACLRKRLPHISNSYICRLLQATDTYLTVDRKLIYLDSVSENTFRPMQHLNQKDCVAIWQWVLENRYQPNQRITIRMISEAMDALNILSHTHCVSEHQDSITVRLDRDLLPKFARHIDRIENAFRSSHINSREEWQHLAKLVYQQLLRNCPVE
ncbi:hypothetical protein [Methylomonas albis]|uniref:Uncharacterized protein n=1 Tax=Methylomonas albis TaxID=1854563 RepID=A0ABR9CVV7_9GAMM|nr:hypothetical protein [Methylomonas albis]MBD9354810.1 hypothetical protein [Methylomonas albis]